MKLNIILFFGILVLADARKKAQTGKWRKQDSLRATERKEKIDNHKVMMEKKLTEKLFEISSRKSGGSHLTSLLEKSETEMLEQVAQEKKRVDMRLRARSKRQHDAELALSRLQHDAELADARKANVRVNEERVSEVEAVETDEAASAYGQEEELVMEVVEEEEIEGQEEKATQDVETETETESPNTESTSVSLLLSRDETVTETSAEEMNMEKKGRRKPRNLRQQRQHDANRLSQEHQQQVKEQLVWTQKLKTHKGVKTASLLQTDEAFKVEAVEETVQSDPISKAKPVRKETYGILPPSLSSLFELKEVKEEIGDDEFQNVDAIKYLLKSKSSEDLQFSPINERPPFWVVLTPRRSIGLVVLFAAGLAILLLVAALATKCNVWYSNCYLPCSKAGREQAARTVRRAERLKMNNTWMTTKKQFNPSGLIVATYQKGKDEQGPHPFSLTQETPESLALHSESSSDSENAVWIGQRVTVDACESEEDLSGRVTSVNDGAYAVIYTRPSISAESESQTVNKAVEPNQQQQFEPVCGDLYDHHPQSPPTHLQPTEGTYNATEDITPASLEGLSMEKGTNEEYERDQDRDLIMLSKEDDCYESTNE